MLSGVLMAGCFPVVPPPALVQSPDRFPITKRGAGKAPIVVAFALKSPGEPWFRREFRSAKRAGDERGFQVILEDVSKPEMVAPAMADAKKKGAEGMVICAPDTRRGPEIVAGARDHGLKLMAVDDQLADAKGEPLDVPYVGINAPKIGRLAGEAMWKEARARKWPMDRVRLLLLTKDSLQTAKDRTDAEKQILLDKGLSAKNVFTAQVSTGDISEAISTALGVIDEHPEAEYWLIGGANDSVVIGGVRATGRSGIDANHVIGVGINGDSALYDLERPVKTGMYASVLLEARVHGHDTAEAMFHWIRDSKRPPDETLTSGTLITRDNFRKIVKESGLSE